MPIYNVIGVKQLNIESIKSSFETINLVIINNYIRLTNDEQFGSVPCLHMNLFTAKHLQTLCDISATYPKEICDFESLFNHTKYSGKFRNINVFIDDELKDYEIEMR